MTLTRAVLFGLGILAIASFIVAALLRTRYPFELEWMEGGILQQVERVLNNEPIYTEPSLEHTPFLYPPLYYYVSAGLHLLIGGTFLPLRLVSFLSSLSVLAAVYAFVGREGGSRFSALLAASLFAGSYNITGAWFDIGRADSLFLALLLWGLYAARFSNGVSGSILAALLVFFSVLTKQTGLVVAVPVGLALALVCRPRGVFFLISLAGAFLLFTLMMNAVSHGWYGYYTLELAGKHAVEQTMLLGFWQEDLLRPMAVACLLAAAAFLFHPNEPRRGFMLFYGSILMGTLAASWLSRLHSGGYVNVLMPLYAAIAILFGIGLSTLDRELILRSLHTSKLRFLLHGAVALQFLVVLYNPATLIPKERDVQTARMLVERIKNAGGPVFAPDQSYLLGSAGQSTHAHRMALDDLLRARDRNGSAIRKALDERIKQRKYALIVVESGWLSNTIETHYKPEGRILYPTIGWAPRRELLYVPRTDQP